MTRPAWRGSLPAFATFNELADAWSGIVGPAIAAVTLPMIFDRAGEVDQCGTLFIGVSTPRWREAIEPCTAETLRALPLLVDDAPLTALRWIFCPEAFAAIGRVHRED